MVREHDTTRDAPRDAANSQHTPGPWKDRIATGVPDHMISGRGEGVCIIPFKYGKGAGTARRNANARLIAAAPEMATLLHDLQDAGVFDNNDTYSQRARALRVRIEGR